MDFTHYDLGDVKRGQYIEIRLTGNAANIRLMDGPNFIGYTKKVKYRYIGGLANQSIVRLQIPRDGRWHVAIDMHGLKGSVKTSYKLLPLTAKQLVQTFSDKELEYMDAANKRSEPESGDEIIIPIDDGVDDETEFIPEYDVFITFAKTEKDRVVLPIAEALETVGIRVWHEGFDIGPGESLRKRIDKGLGNSKFGIVILSRGLAETKEDYGKSEEILLRSMTGEQLILLVRHDITANDLAGYNQSLVNKPSVSTAEYSPDKIADEVVQILKKNEMFY